MDLDEYVFYEKKKDKNFTLKTLAAQLEISENTLSKLIHLQNIPTTRIAYKIETFTEGKVSGWGLIKKYMEKQNA
jgi:transcriptional regulator with XRE-family HTH domain